MSGHIQLKETELIPVMIVKKDCDVKNLSVDEQVKVQVNCLKGIKIVKGQSKPH